MPESYEGPALASTRDASVLARPDVYTSKKLHVAVNVSRVGRNAWGEMEYHGEAACDPDRAPLDMTLRWVASETPDARRCRRRACASRWEAADRG